jgi:hypothetical protein
MALTKRSEIDRIEIVGGWNIQVRKNHIIEEDGKFLSNTFERWTLTPNMDISTQEQMVQDIANVAWTQEVRAAYNDFKAKQI